jgi:peptidoglycan/LPS O-acetylase OafA/YrhL
MHQGYSGAARSLSANRIGHKLEKTPDPARDQELTMQVIERPAAVSTPTFDPRNSPRQTPAYRPDIDGLRALAVTSVVAYHAGLVPGGYIGVDIFFVISGYLIGSHVYKDVRQNRFSLAAFYRRRAKRILPALFTVLLVCYAIALCVLDAPEIKSFAEYAVAAVLSASNILAWLKAGYFAAGADQNPLLMTWSLGVEEQFYLIFPLLMLLFGKMGRKKLLIATITVTLLSLALSIVRILKNPTATFYLLPTRAWELSVGILLAMHEVDRPREKLYAAGRFANSFGLLGLALLVFSIAAYTSSTPFPGIAAVVPVLGSALILISPTGRVNRLLLSSPPFVFLGLLSYSWYLWHWPLLSFARIASDRPVPTLTASIIALLSLAPAWCSWRFIEQPFRKSKAPSARLLRSYAILGALMLIPGLVLVAMKGWPQRFPQLSAIEQRSGIRLNHPCLVDYGAASPNLSPYCVPKEDRRNGVALLGDSHAGSLGEALREMANLAGLKLYEMTKTSCPPLLGVTRRMPNHRGHDRECASFNAKTLDLVRRDRRIQTVVLAGYWSAPFAAETTGERYILDGQISPATPAESSANLGRGLKAMVAALCSSGKNVVIVKDDPLLAFDPVRRLRWSLIPARRAMAGALMPGTHAGGSVPGSEIETREDDIASAIIDQSAGTAARIFDLRKNLCDHRSCYFYADGLLLYADSQHLSLAGARRALHGLPMASTSPEP